jgi:hypothetical protein
MAVKGAKNKRMTSEEKEAKEKGSCMQPARYESYDVLLHWEVYS